MGTGIIAGTVPSAAVPIQEPNRSTARGCDKFNDGTVTSLPAYASAHILGIYSLGHDGFGSHTSSPTDGHRPAREGQQTRGPRYSPGCHIL